MTAGPVNLRSDTPKSYLTLSAAPDLLPEDARSAEHIAAELARVRVARRSGSHRTAEAHLDALIDHVWFSAPDGAA